MNQAPIILFCYQRIDTLKNCIEWLLKCPESVDSELIIFSDAAANNSIELEQNVSTVRMFLQTISGFKSVEINERVKNLGVDYNIITGLKECSKRFTKFIVVEDDIQVLPSFLTYLNKALDFYESNEKVLTISAFSYMKRIPSGYPYDVYFAQRNSPWGWGSWGNRIELVDWEIEDRDAFLGSKKLKNQFSEWGSDMSNMLVQTLIGKIRAWDIRLDYHQFKNDLYTVYPNYTLTENVGFGRNDASNTFGYNRYKTVLKEVNAESLKFSDSVILNDEIVKEFKQKNAIPQRLITRMFKLINYTN